MLSIYAGSTPGMVNTSTQNATTITTTEGFVILSILITNTIKIMMIIQPPYEYADQETSSETQRQEDPLSSLLDPQRHFCQIHGHCHHHHGHGHYYQYILQFCKGSCQSVIVVFVILRSRTLSILPPVQSSAGC